MSRFFGPASDSESESVSSVEDVPQRAPALLAPFVPSDDEEETKRVVRSAKEKRYEELSNIIRQIKNQRKIKDFSNMLSSFDELVRAHTKALPVIRKEDNGVSPRFFIRCLAEMTDLINETWDDKEAKKNMSKNSSKCLATLRQKLRKYCRDNFEDEIAKFRENPDLDDDEAEGEGKAEEVAEESGSDTEIVSRPSAQQVSKQSRLASVGEGAVGEDDDEEGSDDSIDWDEDSDEDSSSSDNETQYQTARERFLKKAPTDKEELKEKQREKERRQREKEQQRLTKKKDAEDKGEGWTMISKGGGGGEKPKMFEKEADVTHSAVMKKLFEIIAARGKKGTDRKGQIELLHELRLISVKHNLGPAVAAKIDFAIISALFDYNPAVSAAMKPEYWVKVVEKIESLLDLLTENKNDLIATENLMEDSEVVERTDPSKPYKIRGCILTCVERMDDEFTRILKECDAHSTEYVSRLRDEALVCRIIDKLQKYLEEQRDSLPGDICRLYIRKVDHLYFKFDINVFKQREDPDVNDKETSIDLMDRLCKYIYVNDKTDRIKSRAILSHIYHRALHDYWYEARDLMLMSHLQDNIQHGEPNTQILYNRTMVQLGLCAFRHGNIREAHDALCDIQSGGRAKELLAQGPTMQRQQERTAEEEKLEKQRRMPFHKHINLELLECVYLVSAMLMEIPYMAAHEFNPRRRLISKSFHHQLKFSERQALVGPPEIMREHVVAASKAMRSGEWRKCFDFIVNEKMNAKVWDLFLRADQVRAMLKRKIQEESLRTYLFTYSHVYATMSLVNLSQMFDLEVTTVHAIVSKMIINEELMASLDEPTQSIVLHRTEPSRLQSQALQLADKIATLVESNDRIFEAKTGAHFDRHPQFWMRGDRFQRVPQSSPSSTAPSPSGSDKIKWTYRIGSTSIKGPSSSIASDGGLSPSVDYDLIVLGGGSGGLSCAKEASDLGANVCLLDFVEPSPRGTKWGLGGTCVNVGCIPKKLMHAAALLGDSLEDARHYGWNVPEGITHDWGKLVQAITMHIRSLTWGYRVQLKTNAVTYMNAIGTFVDSKTIKATDAKGKEKVISANNIVVAVGGRPIYPDDIPGARDIAISSDDIFTLREPPGRTLVIGASYVALECAGFLQGLGYPTSLLIRSIPLRGFDRQMANLVLQDLSSRGTEVIKGVPVSMKRNGSGKAEVTIQLKDGTESVCTYDTVMLATGRRSVAGALGLKEAGVELDEDSGKVRSQGLN
ncbi:unnamed protein product [Cyprideis torosa]|uniref:Eukaryotic translation initiation factor 3 subunit C n=1 Tax=Cyprideis torosa TaxID=163714 RepID=A0A7R8ZNH2_9CRUS|nr:unnamed protein product [Cyprideis torosa]CAG0891577.1 unnamed protein product [Cyprideis torosa]